MKGRFFVLEGIDGSGKSAATLALTQYLNKNGHSSIHTYEPYTNFITDTINDVLYKRVPEPDARIMATLFTASRMHHIEQVVKPAINDGINVVSDRYIFSTFAYNSSMMTRDLIEEDHKEFYYPPDHIFYLACSPQIAIERSQGKKSIFDEDRERLAIISDIYKSMFLTEGMVGAVSVEQIFVCGQPSTVHIIDANQTRAHTMKQIYQVVDPIIHKPIEKYSTHKKHD